jgi:hypothetical protein
LVVCASFSNITILLTKGYISAYFKYYIFRTILFALGLSDGIKKNRQVVGDGFDEMERDNVVVGLQRGAFPKPVRLPSWAIRQADQNAHQLGGRFAVKLT